MDYVLLFFRFPTPTKKYKTMETCGGFLCSVWLSSFRVPLKQVGVPFTPNQQRVPLQYSPSLAALAPLKNLSKEHIFQSPKTVPLRVIETSCCQFKQTIKIKRSQCRLVQWVWRPKVKHRLCAVVFPRQKVCTSSQRKLLSQRLHEISQVDPNQQINLYCVDHFEDIIPCPPQKPHKSLDQTFNMTSNLDEPERHVHGYMSQTQTQSVAQLARLGEPFTTETREVTIQLAQLSGDPCMCTRDTYPSDKCQMNCAVGDLRSKFPPSPLPVKRDPAGPPTLPETCLWVKNMYPTWNPGKRQI